MCKIILRIKSYQLYLNKAGERERFGLCHEFAGPDTVSNYSNNSITKTTKITYWSYTCCMDICFIIHQASPRIPIVIVSLNQLNVPSEYSVGWWKTNLKAAGLAHFIRTLLLPERLLFFPVLGDSTQLPNLLRDDLLPWWLVKMLHSQHGTRQPGPRVLRGLQRVWSLKRNNLSMEPPETQTGKPSL